MGQVVCKALNVDIVLTNSAITKIDQDRWVLLLHFTENETQAQKHLEDFTVNTGARMHTGIQ